MAKAKKMEFGPYIRQLRTDKGITLRTFAKMLHVSPTYVSQIEMGNFSPPAEERVVRMAQILGEDPDELLALAGRVADDLPEIIKEHPREMASFLRSVQGFTAEEITRLLKQAEKIRQQRKPQS